MKYEELKEFLLKQSGKESLTPFEEVVLDIVKDYDIDLNEPYFKEIPGFSNYICDINSGNIFKKVNDGKLKKLKIKPNDLGYVSIRLTDDNGESESHRHHRIVMMSVLESTPAIWSKWGFTEVNHKKNGIKFRSLNTWWNLELDTRKGNVGKAIQPKKKRHLKENELKYIITKFEEEQPFRRIQFYKTMAREFGCTWQTVQYHINAHNSKQVSQG